MWGNEDNPQGFLSGYIRKFDEILAGRLISCSGGRLILSIGYKYNSSKVLGFIATEGGRSTESGNPYLSCFSYIHYTVSVSLVVCPHLLGRYLNVCNAIDNHNSMRQSELELDKYWVTHRG